MTSRVMVHPVSIPKVDRIVKEFAETRMNQKLDGIVNTKKEMSDDCYESLAKTTLSDTSLSTLATPTTVNSISASPSQQVSIKKNDQNVPDKSEINDPFKKKIEESKIVKVLGMAILNMLQANIHKDTSRSIFCCKTEPKISLFAYIERITLYITSWEDPKKSEMKTGSEMSAGLRSLVIALIYLDRLSQKGKSPSSIINKSTIHRLMLIAMTVATKFAEDAPISSKFIAKVGGITVKEVNESELELVKALDYDLYVSESEFKSICNKLFPLAKSIQL